MSKRQAKRARQRAVARAGRRQAQLGKRAGLGVGAALGASVLFAPAADAATFTVTSLADDNTDGTLRNEIADAVAAAGADTIVFASGLSGTIQLTDANDDIEITDGSLSIQGPGASALTVRGDGVDDRIFTLFNFDSANEEVVFSGLTLTGGSPTGSGGAISSDDDGDPAADVVIENSVLTGNESEDEGGAFYTFYSALTVRNSTITNNEAGTDGTGNGGGIYLYGANDDGSEPAALTITNSTIANNSTPDEGGGVYSQEHQGPIVIEGSTISGNDSADEGGGLKLYADDIGTGGEGGPITIRSSTVSANTAGGYGAGLVLYGEEVGATTIQGSTFSANRAEGAGGGIEAFSIGGALLIENTTISGNVADSDGDGSGYGGGVASYNQFDEDAPRTIRNSTIVGNSSFDGGGIARYGFDNAGATGNDILRVTSTIVSGNTAPSGPDLSDTDVSADGAFEIGSSLIGSTAGATVTEAPAGTNLLGVDPQLGPLAANGGPTETHLPAVASPVIDAGVANGLSTDQRALARTFDAANIANKTGSDGTDIGSVELAADGTCNGKPATVLFAPGQPITGSEGDDVIVGTAGNDQISGLGGNDAICAGAGSDKVKTGAGKDFALGEAGKDKISGEAGKDKLKGGKGNDKIKGGAGKDKLSGQAGKDTLKGQGGKDTLKGGAGKDKLVGGPGKDKLKGGGGKDTETQ